MSYPLETSYALCQRLAWRSSTSFYYSFMLLPRPKRRGMFALYAFLRTTDDLGDNPGPVAERRAALGAWRESLDRALIGVYDGPIFPALADTISRFGIPPRYLHDVIDGVGMDLSPRQYESFDDLAVYCRRVASAVGLACLHIWGFDGPAALELADQCGLAFQLTNILRDVKEDAGLGRVYLPLEDLRSCDFSVEDLLEGVDSERFRAVMRLEIARAEELYSRGAGLTEHLTADGRAIFGAMSEIYRALLAEIKRRDGDVLSRRVRVSTWRKLRIAAGWFWRGR